MPERPLTPPMDTPFNETLMWPDGFTRVHSWGYYMAAELCVAYMVLDIIGEEPEDG